MCRGFGSLVLHSFGTALAVALPRFARHCVKLIFQMRTQLVRISLAHVSYHDTCALNESDYCRHDRLNGINLVCSRTWKPSDSSRVL